MNKYHRQFIYAYCSSMNGTQSKYNAVINHQCAFVRPNFVTIPDIFNSR